jgi:hypothetical protein
MPGGDYNPIKPGIAGFDSTTALGAMANGILNQAAVVTSAFRKDGLTVQPFTGVIVGEKDQQEAKFNNFIGGAGGMVGRLSSSVWGATPQTLSKLEHGAWLEKNGYKNVQDHIASALDDPPPQLVELTTGEELAMWIRKGGKPGTYATYPGTSADELAINGADRYLQKFIVKEPFQAVKSKVAEFPVGIYEGVGGKGGGVQYQLPKKYSELVEFLTE